MKSIVVDSEPAAAHLRGRAGLMRRIESRFRFLAVCCAGFTCSVRKMIHADSSTTNL